MAKQIPTTFVLFGATGDLSKQKIIPTLVSLWEKGYLTPGFRLIAVGRTDTSTVEFIEGLGNDLPHVNLLNLEYLKVDFLETGGFQNLLNELIKYINTNLVFYCATPPDVVHLIADRCNDPELRGFISSQQITFVTEKPFGDNLSDAQELNNKLNQLFAAENIYRNDHYIFKPLLRRLLALRKSHTVESHLDPKQLQQIRLIVAEPDELSTRKAYFDKRGMSIDWFQSHVLQMLATIGADVDLDNFGYAKTEFITHLKLVPHSIISGQYEGYDQTDSPQNPSAAETFLTLKLHQTLPGWEHVEIVCLMGKRLKEKTVFVELDYGHGIEEIIVTPEAQDQLSAYEYLINKVCRAESDEFLTFPEIQAQWEITQIVKTELSKMPPLIYQPHTSYLELYQHIYGVESKI